MVATYLGHEGPLERLAVPRHLKPRMLDALIPLGNLQLIVHRQIILHTQHTHTSTS